MRRPTTREATCAGRLSPQEYEEATAESPGRLPDLLTVCKEWEPAVLIREDMEFAGCIAAERCGLSHATVQVTAWRPWLRRHIAGVLNDRRAAVGLPPDAELAMLDRYLVVTTAPPRFFDPAFPLSVTAHAVRHVAFDRSGDEALPAWVAEPPNRPAIYAR